MKSHFYGDLNTPGLDLSLSWSPASHQVECAVTAVTVLCVSHQVGMCGDGCNVSLPRKPTGGDVR